MSQLVAAVDVDDDVQLDSDVQHVDTAHSIIQKSETPPPTTATSTATITSTTPIPDAVDDSASVHSVHSAPAIRSSTPLPRTPSSSSPIPPPSPSRSGHREVAARHRSIADSRSSKRLSGFFNNLIHRRDGVSSNTSRNAVREEAAGSSSSQAEKQSNEPSRASSPTPATIPPPKLPPPTLQELGLSLSVITPDLSPSHFTTPPSSGAFLSPHYLLLCHAQGLDVLPLISPPVLQPYALIRRVSFKSIVVMEHRGVLVAIAGRRDGVRVYALEEVRKAVEWRIDVEVRRERDRSRREQAKKTNSSSLSGLDFRPSAEKSRKPSSSTPPPSDNSRPNIPRKASQGSIPSSVPPVPLIPRTPTIKRPKNPSVQVSPQLPEPLGRPPSYSSHSEFVSPRLRPQSSLVSLSAVTHSRPRGASVSDVLTVPPISRINTEVSRPHDPDSKDYVESSDDEAINVVAAGSSGSQALDERTSARHSSNLSQSTTSAQTHLSSSHSHSTSISRRNRPANLDLSLSLSNTPIPQEEPSPAPTLLTLRQALSQRPATSDESNPDPDTPFGDGEDDEDEVDGQISLTQALLESRLPDLPPPGTRQPQEPILITSSHPIASANDEPASPRTSDAVSTNSDSNSRNRRRRWSLMLNSTPSSTGAELSVPRSRSRERTPTRTALNGPTSATLPSSRTSTTSSLTRRPSSAHATTSPPPSPSQPLLPSGASVSSSVNTSRSTSRFIPRIISNAFHNMRSDDHPSTAGALDADSSNNKKINGGSHVNHAPPPKLEYVKLPGTKGSLMIKAVETAKKSFLAILCGENGEKVELFAGTYRTALGLSRTFILPDSPRSLELQLQGDDLVEVFLVFSQNVFGLEPATVRVREVRIGRAERRAARRRAREIRTGDATNTDAEPQAGEEDTNVNVSIGVSVSVGSTVVASGSGPVGPQTPPFIASQHPEQASQHSEQATDRNSESVPEASNEETSTPVETTVTPAAAQTDEIVALAAARMGPYTTFQQLSFAPRFPLASIADEYVIPPTYPDFIEYRTEHEPQVDRSSNTTDLAQVQFSPPGLPVPTPSAPSKWYYCDPKGVVHGPWKATLMQAWYKDGLLPPDLPVRKEEDTDYILLKDLRSQSVDPTHPFKCVQVTPQHDSTPSSVFQPSDKPLLSPISLLAQPRHFGPPALFFSSRGGHSTTIVDARGRSVLKGRFVWSDDEPVGEDSKSTSLMGRMGDVKRLEAVDIKDRSVLIAMRQGGVEAVDLCDALLRPGDESRTTLPQFNPTLSNINRREPFVWKIGTPVSTSPTSATILSSKSKGHLPKPRLTAGSSKSPAGKTEFNVGDAEPEFHDEVLFLGRKDDEIYICERNAGSFRILRLCPNES